MTQQRSFLAPHLLVGLDLKSDLYINVEQGVIQSVESTPLYPDNTVDLGPDTITYPGCVNTHSHAFQALFRGGNNDLGLMDWLKNLYAKTESATPEDIYRGARRAFTEMIGNGTTSVSDFFYVNGRGNENAHQMIRAAADVGIRLDFHRVIMDEASLSPSFREDVDTGLSRYMELVAAYPASDRLSIGLAAHSIYYSSEAILHAVHEQSVKEGKKWHMHYSDSRATRDMAREKYGHSEARHLIEAGLLGPNFVGIHAIWADDEDIGLLAEAGAQVSHNPISNRFIGEPLPDVYTMLEKGVNVGLGTDGAASSPSLSILEEMKHAVIGQKSRHQDPTCLTTRQGMELATVNGSAITGFKNGLLQTGYFADFMVCDATHPCMLPLENALSHFVYSLSPQAIRKVAVGGEFVVERG